MTVPKEKIAEMHAIIKNESRLAGTLFKHMADDNMHPTEMIAVASMLLATLIRGCEKTYPRATKKELLAAFLANFEVRYSIIIDLENAP